MPGVRLLLTPGKIVQVIVLRVVLIVVWAVVENVGDDPLDVAIVIVDENVDRSKSVPSEFLGEITNS